MLSFVPANGAADATRKPDPAVVEFARHRGRVVVYTSTFNQDWTDWPVLPSYLPFVHEILRFAATNPDRHTIRAGDPIEEFFPASAAGLTAGLTGPEGVSATLPIVLREESGVVRFADTALSGFYRLAVNPPEASSSGGSEFHLRRAEPSDLKAIGPVQVVTELKDAKVTADGGVTVISTPRPHGPTA